MAYRAGASAAGRAGGAGGGEAKAMATRSSTSALSSSVVMVTRPSGGPVGGWGEEDNEVLALRNLGGKRREKG